MSAVPQPSPTRPAPTARAGIVVRVGLGRLGPYARL
jgi:hypothetical protein